MGKARRGPGRPKGAVSSKAVPPAEPDCQGLKVLAGGGDKDISIIEGVGHKVHLGCGNDIKRGWVNLDKNDGNIENKEVVHCDLEEGKLPFADDSCAEVMAIHLLEHIKNLLPLMNEIRRVLRPGGFLRVEVPVYPFPEAFQDPTHVRFFTEQSFRYFVEGEGLYENYGKTYGIKGFSWFAQQISGRALIVSFKK